MAWAAAPSTPFSPFNYPSSFHSLLLDPGSDRIEAAHSKECVAAIRAFLKAGKSFVSSTIDQHSMPLKNFSTEFLQNSTVYHYTNAKALIEIAERKNFNELFSYLRTGTPVRIPQIKDQRLLSVLWFFYVAGDPSSSEMYGKILFKLKLDPEQKIFFSGGDFPGKEGSTRDLINRIESEFFAKEERLRACSSAEMELDQYQNNSQPILVTLGAEANQVAALAYYGLNNRLDRFSGGEYQWLQILGPWAIQSMSLQP
jgi:hypothetical protein